MLIISHRDVNHTDTGTLPTNIYENIYEIYEKEEKEKKSLFVLKRSLSYAPIR